MQTLLGGVNPRDSIWHPLMWKINKIVATRCHMLRLKCIKFDFGWGSAPDPAGWACSTPPDPLAEFKGPTSKEREGRGTPWFSLTPPDVKSWIKLCLHLPWYDTTESSTVEFTRPLIGDACLPRTSSRVILITTTVTRTDCIAVNDQCCLLAPVWNYRPSCDMMCGVTQDWINALRGIHETYNVLSCVLRVGSSSCRPIAAITKHQIWSCCNSIHSTYVVQSSDCWC